MAELRVSIDEDLRVRMIRLGISPTSVVRKALKAEVERIERQLELKQLQEKDPRLTLRDLDSRSIRIRRLRDL